MNASNPTVNVTFSIMDDSVFEPNETLFVNLGFSFASLPGVTLDPTSAEVIILGDDGKFIISNYQLPKSV